MPRMPFTPPGAFHGVKVSVISADTKMPLYHDPDAVENEDPQTRQHYVEAVTGAKFAVKVSLTRRFEVGTAGAIRISLKPDNATSGWFTDVPEYNCRYGQKSGYTFDHLTKFDRATSQWKKGELSFGNLETKETSDSHISLDSAKSLGRIQVTIERVHLRPDPLGHVQCDTDFKRVTEVPEKALKGSGVANTIECSNYTISGPPPIRMLASPILGPLGKPIVINILYRSKRTLQMLGCIPRTPSPEPAARGLEEENKALRARLERLERSANIKPEHVAGIKREREDAEKAASRKRARSSGPTETVDLTDD